MKYFTIGLIGDERKLIASSRYFAQRGDGDEYAFGMTTTEALENLEKRESALAKEFDVALAEEIAFLALGVAECLRDQEERNLCRFCGHMGFISEVISQAPVLLQRWHQVPDGEFSGVWIYDITERFGREWAKALLDGEVGESTEFLERIIADEAEKWDRCRN